MSKAIRKEIEKATFLDGKGKKIIRIGEGLDKDYGDHCDDRNVMCFFTHRWLPRLKEMKTAKEVEKQIDDFFNKIPRSKKKGASRINCLNKKIKGNFTWLEKFDTSNPVLFSP